MKGSKDTMGAMGVLEQFRAMAISNLRKESIEASEKLQKLLEEAEKMDLIGKEMQGAEGK